MYPSTLLNSLMSSSSFLVTSFGFSMYTIMSSANRDSFTSFPICVSFISYFYLVTIAITSKIMFNKSGESGHACLVPDLIGCAFSFSLKSCSSVPTFWRVLIINGCRTLSKLFLYLLRWSYSFILQFVDVVYHTD